MKNNIELKSCPFCAGVARVKHVMPFGICFIECSSCGASTRNIKPELPDKSQREKVAAELWNKRVGV